jgi:hypothetical protein
MTLVPISATCPQCGGGEVFYSCKPECCYNHVCNYCYTTFKLGTTRVGETAQDFEVAAATDGSAPTAPCARCHEPTVLAIAGSPQCVCTGCRALLRLEYREIVPSQ